MAAEEKKSLPSDERQSSPNKKTDFRLHYFPDIPVDGQLGVRRCGSGQDRFQRTQYDSDDSACIDDPAGVDGRRSLARRAALTADEREEQAYRKGFAEGKAQGLNEGQGTGLELGTQKIEPLVSAIKEAYYQTYRSDKMSFLPKLNAFGTYELHDEQVFRGSASGYLFGAELRWDVLNGTKRFGKAHKSKAEFEKAKLELELYKSESQLELNKARRMLQDTKNNLELTTLALNQSKEALRIRSNRFAQGLEKTTDLLLAETQYAQKQLEYYFTIFQHNSAVAYMEFLTKE